MSERELFEKLKQGFIHDTTKHLEEIKKLSFEDINTNSGIRLVELRSKAVESSVKLAHFITKKRMQKFEG